MEAFILLGFSGMGNRYGSESIEPVKVVIYFNICKPMSSKQGLGEFPPMTQGEPGPGTGSTRRLSIKMVFQRLGKKIAHLKV
jgi:hypothetical protein